MNLIDLGYNDILDKFRAENITDGLEPGRVTAEHKERYLVKINAGELEAEITGNLRFTAQSREDFPAVGDWVALATFDSGFGLIHQILPRFSVLKRLAPGTAGGEQIIATNIDCALLVQAAGHDFNINRLERYLTLCNSSNIHSVIILTKIDLFPQEEVNQILEKIKTRIKNVPVIPISNETQSGYQVLNNVFEKGKTYCLLGSSGVGKSTLLNHLSGWEKMKTGNISESTNKGKHVTSHRELVVLPNGGVLIDNPGMREVGLADTSYGLEMTFDVIETYAKSCRFKDCTHTGETGCAVVEAVEKGEIDRLSYENFLKMEKEKEHYFSTILERRKKEKEFGRQMKNYKKDMRKGKF